MPNQLGNSHETVVCPHCFGALVVATQFPKKPFRFCPYCGVSFFEEEDKEKSVTHDWSQSIIPEQFLDSEAVQFSIGPYQILKKIGEGGMGEVFLAYDIACGRKLALKRIREDLKEHRTLYNRFLREARITSQLTHPAIIPIYAIHREGSVLYYTMPYIEGQTLKELLRKTKEKEKKGLGLTGGSIPSLIRIFISVCQAIAYAHSKGVFHRDIKPENIIVGRYGEVKILDWGLAKLIESDSAEDQEFLPEGKIIEGATRAGKVVGTLSYMAPERAQGAPASVRSEVYALGVVLYQILTLNLPFKRKSFKDFVEVGDHETARDPQKVAPYRDIPKVLVETVKKCLEKDPEKRYPSVKSLIYDLESFIEGRSEWFLSGTLDYKRKEDWEFQENVLLAEHTAVTAAPEESRWVNLMVSKLPFSGNTRIELEVTFFEGAEGLGILFSLPEKEERTHFTDSYCFWISSDKNTPTKLLRSGIEILQAPDLILTYNKVYKIAVDKVDQSVKLFIDGTLSLSYLSHLPQEGSHVGLMYNDTCHQLSPIKVFEAGQNVLVKCLAVPDAFLSHKDFNKALAEYRRIGASFPGRAEGREALFRAGITLLEQGKASKLQDEQEACFSLAFEEFDRLLDTPGAPLSYLGKALIYEAEGETDEEVKCYDMAWRRYPHHPLLSIVKEHLLYRTQATSRTDRWGTYAMTLELVRHVPDLALSEAGKLIQNLKKHREAPWFMVSSQKEDLLAFGIELAYHTRKGYLIKEFASFSKDPLLLQDALALLFDMGEDVDPFISEIAPNLNPEFLTTFQKLRTTDPHLDEKDSQPLILFGVERALFNGDWNKALKMTASLEAAPFKDDESLHFIFLKVAALFLADKFDLAGEILETCPLDLITLDQFPLFFLFGCWLARNEGKEIGRVHFQGVLDTPYPKSRSIGAHLLSGKLDLSKWLKSAFFWEKRALAFQMTLYHHVVGDQEKENAWREILQGTSTAF